ncbi:MAG TPA: class III signal peptide-containing protein [Candidatus Nanoarchaeia archaeon]|nr:class III signal peptide-containing protein [Candidatus Nanoarchaeia archaeon]
MKKREFRKAQGAFEFIFLIGVALTASVIFLIASFSDIDELTQKKEFMMLKEQGDRMHTEISLALRVEDGYSRSFLVPQMLENRDYTVVTANRTITLTSDRSSYSFRIPSIDGNITKGMNNITRES